MRNLVNNTEPKLHNSAQREDFSAMSREPSKQSVTGTFVKMTRKGSLLVAEELRIVNGSVVSFRPLFEPDNAAIAVGKLMAYIEEHMI